MSVPITLTYYDTAMMLLEIGPFRLLTDPVFDPADAVFDYGPVRLTKTAGNRVTPELLGHVDAVLLSHDQHGDNLDTSGRAFAASAPIVITTELAATRLTGRKVLGLRPWEATTLTGPNDFELTVRAAPAQHGPDGTESATGPVIGFLIQWPGQTGGPIYISGDTVPSAATRQIAERASPVSIAILHIGRVRLAPMGDTPLSMSASQAVEYAEALRAELVVPVHYEGWAHFTEGREEASRAFSASSIAHRVLWLEPGRRNLVRSPG